MKYEKTIEAKFIERPNRFVAIVEINEDGAIHRETVHVKNTGRCRELLLEGARVVLSDGGNPQRKTKYDLIAVWKTGLGWINIDSQAPNAVAKEWLESGKSYFDGITYIKPEFVYGESRIDFYIEQKERRTLMEVKGCTLEIDREGYFPDAPTERGVKHLRELTGAVKKGYRACIAFVIAMEGIERVHPNVKMHPEFGRALAEAVAAGVEILYLCCEVKKDELNIIKCLKETERKTLW